MRSDHTCRKYCLESSGLDFLVQKLLFFPYASTSLVRQIGCKLNGVITMIIHGPDNCSEKISLTSKPESFYIPFYLLLFCVEGNECYILAERTIKTLWHSTLSQRYRKRHKVTDSSTYLRHQLSEASRLQVRMQCNLDRQKWARTVLPNPGSYCSRMQTGRRQKPPKLHCKSMASFAAMKKRKEHDL